MPSSSTSKNSLNLRNKPGQRAGFGGIHKMEKRKKIAGNLAISFLIALTVIFLIVATASL